MRRFAIGCRSAGASPVRGSWPMLLAALSAIFGPKPAVADDRPPITDKTLVAWVAPANLTQRGGSVLTLEKTGGAFDGIVFGEITPAKWMAGSDGFSRTQRAQERSPAETSAGETLLQIAIVYKGKEITVYRDGVLYARYAVSGTERFSGDSLVLMGLRHQEAAPENRFFVGSIDDARIYGVALSAEQVHALKPNQPSDPQPLAWWDFEEGRVGDRMRRFPTTSLFGDARISGGRLQLGTPGAYLTASNLNPQATADLSNVNSSARALREKLLSDPYRPGYHFVTPEGTCMPFDPNGAIFWKGRYHLFYIFQDARGHNWGHVSSTDLFHWRHHPTGLVAGMFSGNCFINQDGRPTICYHQVGQGNAMAVALDDDLNEWKKLDTNPITPKTEPGDPNHDRYRSWDPYGWVEDGTYYAIFGGNRPAVVKSKSLAGPWKYVGDLMANAVPGVSIDEDVSCADFFPIGGKRMLLCISHRLGARYYLGEWKNERFHPTFHEKMSWIDNSFFAPESLLDDQGRRIMWSWIFDGPAFATRRDFGWSGTMSLPRVLSLGPDGRLRMNPPVEIDRLRYKPRSLTNLDVAAEKELALDGIAGNSIELGLEIKAPQASQFGIKVCRSPGGEEETLVYYDRTDKKLKVDTTKSSLTEDPKGIEAGPFELPADEPLQLRVFVDRSVVEVFANGKQAVMRRVYPSRADSVGTAVFSRGGPARLTKLSKWEMAPSNPY